MKEGTLTPYKTENGLPSLHQCHYQRNHPALEPFHLCLRTFPLVGQQMALLCKEVGGIEMVAALADAIKDDDIVLHRQLKSWYNNRCKGKPQFSMPRTLGASFCFCCVGREVGHP